MIAFLKRNGLYVVLTILGIGLGLWFARRAKPTPIPVAQSVVEQIAQHTAAAIVVTHTTDSALARHAVATRHVLAIRADTSIAPVERLVQEDSVLTNDNEQLAAQLEATKAVVEPDTLARVPQDSVPAVPRVAIHAPSIAAVIGKAVLANVTIGYGATYAGTTVTLGPSVALGLHLTSGRIGATAGAVVTYGAGALHAGIGVAVGVRL